MADIIDDEIFSANRQRERQECLQGNVLIEQLSKYMNSNGEFLRTHRFKRSQQIIRILYLEQTQYLVTLSFQKGCKNLMVSVREMMSREQQENNSKHREMLLIKDLTKNQYDKTHEAVYYSNRGFITMVLRFYFQGREQNKKYWVQFWSKIIAKNIHYYHYFCKAFTRKTAAQLPDRLSEFHQELLISQAVNTTPPYFDICQQKSQFKLAQQTLYSQRQAISQIRESIVIEADVEKLNTQLFDFMKNQQYSAWLYSNLIDSYQTLHSKAKRILVVKKPQQKKIQDFLFNMAQVQIKQKSANMIGSGGSSNIYIAKANISFVNSADFTLLKRRNQKSEMIIAIKQLKPQLPKEYHYKLAHQKEMISKLKGSCSIFFPKYYGTSKVSDLSNVLLMQVVNGYQLDDFFRIRSYSSLWTKILILINIVHGLRHLVSEQIVHLDIKPGNIKVCENLITKIFDFGQAYHKDNCNQCIHVFTIEYCPGYTFPYSSPQVYERFEDKRRNRPLKKLQFNEKQDVFAFGIIMYQVLFERKIVNLSNQTSKHVYYHHQLLHRVFQNHQALRAYGTDRIISTLLHIIVSCLHPIPQYRPKFDWIGVVLKLILNSHTL